MWHQDITLIQWLLRLEKELWNPTKLEAVVHLFPWWRGKILKNMEEMVHRQAFGKTGHLAWPHRVWAKAGAWLWWRSHPWQPSAHGAVKTTGSREATKCIRLRSPFYCWANNSPITSKKLPSVTNSKLLCSPHKRPMNPRFKVLKSRERILFRELVDQEYGRLISQNNHLVWVWMPGSFMNQRWREVRKQSKKAINLANIS